MDDERAEFISAQVNTIIDGAIDGDAAAIGEALAAIGARYGHDGVYVACCSLAEIIHRRVFPDAVRGSAELTNEQVAERLGPPATDRSRKATVWAARFVMLYINGDARACANSFYWGLTNRQQSIVNVAALVALTGEVLRPEPDKKEDDADG